MSRPNSEPEPKFPKKTLADELREKSRKGELKAEEKMRKARQAHQEDIAVRGKAMFDRLEPSLKEKMEKAASRGETAIEALGDYYGGFDEVDTQASICVDRWARERGLHTHHASSPAFGSDGSASESMSICWKDHSNDSRGYW